MASPPKNANSPNPIAFFGLMMLGLGGYALWLPTRLLVTPQKHPGAAWFVICTLAAGLLFIALGLLVLWRSGKPLSNHQPYSDAGRYAEIRLREVLWTANGSFALFIILLILSVVCLTYEIRFVHLSTTTRGDVVKVAPGKGSDTVSYSFADAHGVNRRDSAVCWKDKYKIGDNIDLLYVIGTSGAHTQVAGFWDQWLFTVICFVGAGSALLVSRFLRSYFRKAIRRLDEIERGSVPSAQARALIAVGSAERRQGKKLGRS